MTLPVAILAGGLATRLRPVTTRIPKALVEVAGRPFAEHQLRLLADAGVERVVFCIGHLGEMIVDALGDGARFGLEIRYAFDGDSLLGTGGALRRALPSLGEQFLVLYGDSYLRCDYALAAETFRASGKLGLMTVYRNRDAGDRSNVHFEGGEILRYDKRNPTRSMEYIDYGLGALDARALQGYPERAAFDLASVYEDLVARRELASLEVEERFYEIGSPEGLAELAAYLDGKRTRR